MPILCYSITAQGEGRKFELTALFWFWLERVKIIINVWEPNQNPQVSKTLKCFTNEFPNKCPCICYVISTILITIYFLKSTCQVKDQIENSFSALTHRILFLLLCTGIPAQHVLRKRADKPLCHINIFLPSLGPALKIENKEETKHQETLPHQLCSFKLLHFSA